MRNVLVGVVVERVISLLSRDEDVEGGVPVGDLRADALAGSDVAEGPESQQRRAAGRSRTQQRARESLGRPKSQVMGPPLQKAKREREREEERERRKERERKAKRDAARAERALRGAPLDGAHVVSARGRMRA